MATGEATAPPAMGWQICTPGEVGAAHVPLDPWVDDTVTFSALSNFPVLSAASTAMRCVPAASDREVFTLLPAI